ncbi:MAG: pyruvate, water dikinase regulatory protein [Synechococcaceae cyanobacterium]|nr:pyruvate, water dikinase regulatory protein [Synechococcaceae cyanobacterium]
METKQRRRHVFIVSDATGETCETVVKAALTQFGDVEVILDRCAQVRTEEQIHDVLMKAAQVNGVVIYTMVSVELRNKMLQMGLATGVVTLDILGPILTRLSRHLELSPRAQPGLFQHLDTSYYQRLEAVDFTVKHDDGLGAATLDQSEIVLVGVSRTSKTPVALYLSFRGWRVANIPLVPGIDLPPELSQVNPRRIIGFVTQPRQLHTLRLQRQRHLQNHHLGGYADLKQIENEIQESRRIFTRHGWPVLDVTAKAIEETASEVMQIIYSRTGESKHRGNDH